MREIKFRAWLKNRKVMGKVLEIYFKNENTIYAINDGEGKTWFDKEDENAVIMQFTGLKDKNGKEIYEGDIVVFLNFASNKPLKGYVRYYSGAKPIIDISRRSLDITQCNDNDLEVIGNIYENSELLDGDDE